MNTNAEFDHGLYYHLYGRTNNKELLFKSQDNRDFFLRRLKHYLGDYILIHAYALMSNHYHLSIKVKDEKYILISLQSLSIYEMTNVQKEYIEEDSKEKVIAKLISSQFRRFFISYSQAFNKRHERTGNLFNRTFKRSIYDPEIKFKYLQFYIHHNGRKHSVVKSFEKYLHQSYHEIVKGDSDVIDMNELIFRFGTIEEFVSFHNAVHYEEKFEDVIIEEEW